MSSAGRKVGLALVLAAAGLVAALLLLARPSGEERRAVGERLAAARRVETASREVPATPVFETPVAAALPPAVAAAIDSSAVADIVGRLVGPDERPASGSVTAHGPDDWFDVAAADFDRGFRFFQPHAGRYDLTVRAHDLMQAAPVIVDLGAGEPQQPVTIQMLRPEAVEGEVVFSSPAARVPCTLHVLPEIPVERLRVHLQEAWYASDIAPADDGRFTLALHPTVASTVTCTADLPMRPEIRLEGVLPADGPLRFEFTDAMLAGSTIEGTVLDAAAQADMTGFMVRLWRAETVQQTGLLIVTPVRSDRGTGPGRFRFDHLAAGQYFVGAESLGFIGDAKGPVAATAPGALIPLELHTPGDLVVRVVDEHGVPVKGATVRCGVAAMPWPRFEAEGLIADIYGRTGTVPGEDGQVALRNLAPGEFWVAAAAGELLSPAARVQIADGLTRTVELVVQELKGLGEISVHVIDTFDKDVAGADVTVTRVLGPRVSGRWANPHGRTGADGRMRFTNAPPGLWSIDVRPNYLLTSTVVGVANGGTSECVVRVLRRP